MILSALSSALLAGTMGPVESTNVGWVGTISLGPVWENAGSAQTIFLTPDIVKTYASNRPVRALFDGEFFLGVQKSVFQTLQSQLGLAVAATDDATLSGNIWDDADPTFNNFTYGYKIQHVHVAVKGKLLYDACSWVIPWVSASLGLGFNHAHSFESVPTIFEALPTPGFSSRRQTSFSYTLGAGVQKAINPHWQVGLGYEFADWGQSRLGQALGQTLNSGLRLNHLYTNGFLINLTYLV